MRLAYRKQVKIFRQLEFLPASCRSLIVDPKLKGAGAKLRSYEWSTSAETEEEGSQKLGVSLSRNKLRT